MKGKDPTKEQKQHFYPQVVRTDGVSRTPWVTKAKRATKARRTAKTDFAPRA